MKLLSIPGQTSRLSSMEGLRAYAVVIVFLFHAGLIIQKKSAMSSVALDWMLHSQYGVDLFFILSGYLIAGLVAKPDFQFGHYLLHRFVRIYPALLGMLFVCTLGLVLMRGEHVTIWRVVGNVLLLNGLPIDVVQPINNVTWSLTYEFAFYFTFPPLYRRFGLFGAALITGIALIPLCVLDLSCMRFMFFFAGAWLKLRPADMSRLREPVVIVLYVAVTTATIYVQKVWIFLLAFLPVATLLVDKALHAKDGILYRVLSLQSLRVIGNVSYSFYLLHPIGLLVGRLAVNRLGLQGLAWSAAFISVSASLSCLLAAGSFVVLERPYFLYRNTGLLRS